MTITELKEWIEQLELNVGEDEAAELDVHIAEQPGYPLDFELQWADPFVHDGKVYLIEGGNCGYLPGEVSKELGWR